MTAVLIIDDHPAARMLAATVARERCGLTVLEAPDGIAGLDLLVAHRDTIALVMLDISMPDLDGYDTCLRIRTLTRDRAAPLPILPFTGIDAAEPFLRATGCLPPLLKPATPEALEAALHRALQEPMPHGVSSGLLAYAERKAAESEQHVRLIRQRPRVALLARAAVIRAGLLQVLAAAGADVVLETASSAVLGQAFAVLRPHVLAASADDVHTALELGAHAGVSVVVIAATEAEARTLERDPVVRMQAAGIVDGTNDAAAPRLAAVFASLVGPQAHQPTPPIMGHSSALPSNMVAAIAGTSLSAREAEVLWLDRQGHTTRQMAEQMSVTPETIHRYWNRIYTKLAIVEPQAAQARRRARAWLAARLGA